MSVLLIEDSPMRIQSFRRACIGISLTQLCTANLAIQWLEDHTPKLIFLDYDLHEYGGSRAETGCGGDVAAWICKRAKRFHNTLVVIHSLNEEGGRRMSEKLQRCGLLAPRMPFVWERPLDLEHLLAKVA